MGIIDFFINLLKDPRGFIAGWIIALGPVWVYTPLFLIVFVETGLVFFPFLPGDSLLSGRRPFWATPRTIGSRACSVAASSIRGR